MAFPVGRRKWLNLRAGAGGELEEWALTRKEVRVRIEISDVVLRVGIRYA